MIYSKKGINMLLLISISLLIYIILISCIESMTIKVLRIKNEQPYFNIMISNS